MTPETDLNRLATSLSLSGVIFQARNLIIQLNRINDEEYPREARLVRDVFLSIAKHILEQLRELHDPNNPFELDLEKSIRVQALAKYLRDLHSYIRYLSASSPRQSPPAVQTAIAELTTRCFPSQHGEPVCIVRPQWTYNLKCVPLSQELKKFQNHILDPHHKLPWKQGESILPALWEKHVQELRAEEKEVLGELAPTQIGILSFAAIDTTDALFLPLLGHELGHFIAFSPPNPYHEDPELLQSARITEDVVREAIESVTRKPANSAETARYHLILRTQTLICLRELLADRIAARILGFSFFLAQAKFLKTTLNWNRPLILETGYPNIKLRLSEILKEVTAEDFPGNPLSFLKTNRDVQSDISDTLTNYFEVWTSHLKHVPVTVYKNSELFAEELLVEPLYKLVEEALGPKTLNILGNLARKIVPEENCARLSIRFFERISRLRDDLPPSVATETTDSFAEIMSAAWAYQVMYGESRENEKSKVNKRFEEHSKTCRLMLKAIELIPVQAKIEVVADSRGPASPSPEGKSLFSVFRKAKGSSKGVLGYTDIRERALRPLGDPQRIDIAPLRVERINGASLDVHLGSWFAYARRTKLTGIKIGDAHQEALLRSVGQGEAFVPQNKTFLLHPGDLALGVTEEFIALPRDVIAFVEGRSGLGRLGLFVATATQIAPGFHGVIVLELANAGTVPLELKPGLQVAQLIFQVMSQPVPEAKLYDGKYYCQIKPLPDF